MSTFLFRFFGPGQVVDTHKSLVPLRSRKQLALLAYLATEYAIAHSRESLVALLWPEVAPTTAQNNLRVTLSRLRKLATKLTPTEPDRPPLLITDRHTVQIDAAWIEDADTNQFNQLLVRTRRHAHPSRSQCDHCQTLLRQAVLLYQGEFLEGFGLNDCDTFEEWLSVERERLQRLVLDAYADLATYAEHNNDLAAAHDAAQRQIELDPLRESAYQQQMRILTKLGKRNAALTLFEHYRTLLRNELGIDPQLETLTLHAEILNSEVAPSITTATWQTLPRNAPPRHNLPQQLTPFIGREEELAALQTRLKNRSYRLISIVGPGGI
ncbi:MAG: winged helix-turn-helix domain-containing protein, partial [Anaerolineales bacterium]|nr:winged helix-turn-helix domain-containing protein [Anaerolineales bacterium]